MFRLPRLRVVIAAWIFTEIILFALVAGAIGVPNTILLGAATSLAGFLLLRHGGTAAIGRLRGLAPAAANGTMVDDVGRAAAGLSLILPGFLSDLVGAALLITPVRRRLAAKLLRVAGASTSSPARPGTVDLDRSEWQTTDRNSEPPSRLTRRV